MHGSHLICFWTVAAALWCDKVSLFILISIVAGFINNDLKINQFLSATYKPF